MAVRSVPGAVAAGAPEVSPFQEGLLSRVLHALAERGHEMSDSGTLRPQDEGDSPSRWVVSAVQLLVAATSPAARRPPASLQDSPVVTLALPLALVGTWLVSSTPASRQRKPG